MGDNRVGMGYDEGRARVKRLVTSSHGNTEAKANLCNSIVNQVRLREGSGAAKEIMKEFGKRG